MDSSNQDLQTSRNESRGSKQLDNDSCFNSV